jgi:fatty-acyl-CoA synthase
MTTDPMSYEPLTPTVYLDRAAAAHGDRIGVIDGEQRWTYAQLHDRSARLAGALAARAHSRPVAVLAPNSHVMLEAHFGVPWAGVPLLTLNTRLSAPEITYILGHSRAAVLVHDPVFDDLVAAAVAELPDPPQRIRADADYEEMLVAARPLRRRPADERAVLSINYTSGTTGRPKGVLYHHRGAYLQALAMVAHMGLNPSSVKLWTLPMFHCNGWCSRGPSPPPEPPMCACAGSTPTRCGGSCAMPVSPTSPEHRPSCPCSPTRPPPPRSAAPCGSRPAAPRRRRRSCGEWTSSVSRSPTSTA